MEDFLKTNKICIHRVSSGSVGRASAPYTNAMSSQQRIRVRFHLWPFAACRSLSLLCFLSTLQLSCPGNKGTKSPKKYLKKKKNASTNITAFYFCSLVIIKIYISKNFMCFCLQIYAALNIFFGMASIGLLTVVAIDRYLTICRPDIGINCSSSLYAKVDFKKKIPLSALQ